MKLSIIIPVYNVERWIDRCLDSLLSQDVERSEYEVVVVDDETPDNSMSIVEKYRENNENIRVVTQKNKGLSGARNAGLEVAKGEYVWFVDSDDFIEPNVLSRLLETVYKFNLDVLCFNLNIYKEEAGKEKYPISFETEEVLDGVGFIEKVDMPPAAWVALYRREFLEANSLFFKEGILHEDQEFTPRAYYLANRIKFENIFVYNYFQREGSIMKSKSAKKCRDLLIVADSLNDFAEGRCADRKSVAYLKLKNKVAFALSQSLKNYEGQSDVCLDDYKARAYYPVKINSQMSRIDKVKYMLMNLSLKLYLKFV